MLKIIRKPHDKTPQHQDDLVLDLETRWRFFLNKEYLSPGMGPGNTKFDDALGRILHLSTVTILRQESG